MYRTTTRCEPVWDKRDRYRSVMRIITSRQQQQRSERLAADQTIRQQPEPGAWSPSAHWQNTAQRLAKRGIDLLAATVILLCLTPVWLAAAILVRLTSAGPVLFRQTRVGKDGRSFTIYKFRTMYNNNDWSVHQAHYAALVANDLKPTAGTFKLVNDSRITSVGRTLRKLSIDELPQLINVLKGDMSLVGPRPPLPYEVVLYDKQAQQRLAVKPGITGLWQVRGRNALNFRQMIELDLEYIRCWSIILDIQILLLTPWAVVKAVGAG
jgi:lipopolysaccharide/colanic/teichoic acid biosynthesis glycosyltransferase